jgi:uncharacterized peroxidase-related enzyme
MFLKEVEAARGGRYGELINKALETGRPVSGIWHLFAFKPEATAALSELTEAVMRGPSALTVAQRELIAAFTSATNRCPFCTGSHVAIAGELSGDLDAVKDACSNPRTAPISEPEKALLAYVEKVTLKAASITRADVDAVKAAGWSDEAIYDAVFVCALFNFYNRWNDGNGTPDLSAEAYASNGKRLAEHGYK